MNAQQVLFFLSIAVAAGTLLTIIGGVLKAFFQIGARLSAVEVKVNTMWDFLLRRAKSELVATGLGTMNSPIKILPEAFQMVAPVLPLIKEPYLAHEWDKLPDAELAQQIENRFGELLLTKVCAPNKLFMGACLAIVLAALKGTDTI